MISSLVKRGGRVNVADRGSHQWITLKHVAAFQDAKTDKGINVGVVALSGGTNLMLGTNEYARFISAWNEWVKAIELGVITE